MRHHSLLFYLSPLLLIASCNEDSASISVAENTQVSCDAPYTQCSGNSLISCIDGFLKTTHAQNPAQL